MRYRPAVPLAGGDASHAPRPRPSGPRRRRLRRHVRRRRRRGAGRAHGQDGRPRRARPPPRRADHRRAGLDRHRQQGGDRRPGPRVLPAGQEALRPPEAWTRQKREEYRLYRRDDDALWTFEPHVAERVFEAMLDEHGSPSSATNGSTARTASRRTGSGSSRSGPCGGKTYRGRMFIDATYEGDLMAAAGVTLHRRPRGERQYGETLNGVQTKSTPTSTSSSGRSIRTSPRATRRAACCPASTPARPARTARATTACRPTASACA